jgi:hypothetical protein
MLEVGNGGLTAAEERAHFSLWAALKAPLTLGCDLTRVDAATLGVVSNPEVIAINQDALGAQARRVWSSSPGASSVAAFRHVPNATLAGGALWRQEPLSLAGARALCALGGASCTGFTLASDQPDPDQRVPVQFFAGGTPRPTDPGSSAHSYVKRDGAPPATWQEVWAGPLLDGALAVVLFNRDDVAQKITARWTDLGLCAAQRAVVRDLWAHERVGVMSSMFTALVQPHGADAQALLRQHCAASADACDDRCCGAAHHAAGPAAVVCTAGAGGRGARARRARGHVGPCVARGAAQPGAAARRAGLMG